MKADLHTHTCYSKDSLTTPQDLVAACMRRGVAVLAVTDHNAIDGALAAREAADQWRAAGRPAPRVIVGEEVMTTAGEVIGLFLSELIPRGLSPQETVEHIRRQGGLVVVPHPFDRLRRGPMTREALAEIAPLLDAIEVCNARTSFAADNEQARAFAVAHGLLHTAGSDAHSPGEVGQCFVDVPDFADVADFRRALAQGEVGGRLSLPLVHLHSSYAKLRKRLDRAGRWPHPR
ncbi:MAG: PHP domain-containing protein [Chloroflexi bacterium]|nr:PHP domain-containing protein [Chloroflexota bacterium]MBU1747070.1 PHP domain-containing protein [Chloroflexota bacterium]